MKNEISQFSAPDRAITVIKCRLFRLYDQAVSPQRPEIERFAGNKSDFAHIYPSKVLPVAPSGL